jgi:pilus assembly protein CpaF
LEDTAELQLANAHIVRLETRPSTPDGIRPILLDELVRTAMRLRPDRLVVGEVRGNEVTGLVQAMNTGHDGSLATCHANGPIDALLRLETLVMQAAPSWPLAAIRAQLSRSIDVIVHVARTASAARQIVEVVEVVPGDGPPAVRPLATGSAVIRDLTRRRA